MADFERQMAQADRSGVLSKGLRSAGELHPETAVAFNGIDSARHNPTSFGTLIRIRDGEIDHL